MITSHSGPERLTFADFIREFDRKYFPKEAMDRNKCEFEHVSQGEMSVMEYEVVFNQLRRFAGVGISEEDLIRKFLSGMRVEIRNRCRVVTYHRLGDLVEKASEQEAGLAEEKKLAKAVHVKSGKAPESQRRGGDQSGLPRCPHCHRSHSGQCMRCLTLGKMGHTARDCPRRGNAALPPPPKRLAIPPRVFAVGDPQGAKPIAGSVLVGGELAYSLFDTGASHSFVSPRLVQSLSFRGVFEPKAKQIQTAGTEKLGAVGIHHNVPVILGGVELLGDLTELEMSFYDVILGMDWLSRHRVVLE
ncbi:uncharacterized protein LOC111201461 [Brassica napus]|uniref:uncharacterized protein LOC111201461 n=1 Tax=Brassica napus TaxID=3708 RepID=UPI000BBF0F2B|nr:uncharacterized protein LOC111201461 [Brassica napus]